MGDVEIKKILEEVRSIAVIGGSTDTSRPSYGVIGYLVREGYDVYPVNPGHTGEAIHGRQVYASLDDLPRTPDMVDCFRRSDAMVDVAREAVKSGASVLWMQLGVINEEAAKIAREAGMTVVMDRCPAIEGPRLGV
ncbi:MAG: CoA-binding protein [Alphaproteobacteria bacterium]|nr:CoA-binding protein [Alphaproteobacteria bacterium]